MKLRMIATLLWVLVFAQAALAQEFVGLGGQVQVRLLQFPPAAGPGVVLVQVETPQGQPAPGWQVIPEELFMPGMEMRLAPVEAASLGQGQWRLQLHAPMAGLWKLRLQLRQATQTDQVVLTFVIP